MHAKILPFRLLIQATVTCCAGGESRAETPLEVGRSLAQSNDLLGERAMAGQAATAEAAAAEAALSNNSLRRTNEKEEKGEKEKMVMVAEESVLERQSNEALQKYATAASGRVMQVHQ